MKQDSLSHEKHSSSNSLPIQSLPLEIINLLKVFARIETRRQEKLRTARKEVA